LYKCCSATGIAGRAGTKPGTRSKHPRIDKMWKKQTDAKQQKGFLLQTSTYWEHGLPHLGGDSPNRVGDDKCLSYGPSSSLI